MTLKVWAAPRDNGDRSFLLTCPRGRKLLVAELTLSRLCGDGSCDTLRGKWVQLGPRGRRGRVIQYLGVAETKTELARILGPIGRRLERACPTRNSAMAGCLQTDSVLISWSRGNGAARRR